MALHLNLIHEVASARRAAQRDPLKLSLWGLGLIAAMFAAYYFFQLARMSVIAQEYARKQSEFTALEPKAKAAKQREDELTTTIRTRDTLVERIEGRFYWAPVVEQLAQVVPREVQLTKLSGDVQGEGLKKCRLSIDGHSAGPDPRKVAEDLRTAIADSFGKKYKNVTSSFRMLEDGVEMAQLDGKAWPTATFAITVEMQSGTEPTPPPTPAKGRSKKK